MSDNQIKITKEMEENTKEKNINENKRNKKHQFDDKFIDDVTSTRYNTWVNGKTDAKSYESMLIPQYKMGVVINYNMNPTIVGSGSAIFMHLWRSPVSPTAGCVAMDERHLLSVMHWLDKSQHPFIYIS